MKTKLLRKIRENNSISHDTKKNLYRYRYGGYQPSGAASYSYMYDSGWVDSISFFKNKRNRKILEEAKEYFNKSRFTYKRKRKSNIISIY